MLKDKAVILYQDTTMHKTNTPTPPKDKGRSASLPTVDIFLDPSVVPSLPPPGGSTEYISVVRGRSATPPVVTYETLKSGSGGRLSPGDVVVGGSWSAGDSRPFLSARTASLEAGNRAGVGAGHRTLGSTLEGHGEVGKEKVHQSGGHGGVPIKRLEPPQPGSGCMQRTSSFEDGRMIPVTRSGTVPIPKPGPARGRIARGHQRTASDSTVGSTITLHRGSTTEGSSWPGCRHGVPPILVAGDECIRLGTERDLPTTTKVLLALEALTPLKRAPLHPVPVPASGLLHPATLLTPLAIVLEALVAERSVLQNEPPASRLPPLRDGSRLQLECGQGQLDWSVMKPYVLAVGQVLALVVPYLQSASSANKGQAAGGADVQGVTRGVRMYVSKQKKVFGQVAGLYVDGYGFTKGWWDESGMKACAGEVGRWSDVFDA